MNLQDTIKGMQKAGYEVALELGQHVYCDLSSNCPLAIELRRVISDCGITAGQLAEGYEQVVHPYNPFANIRVADVSGTLNIVLGEKSFSVDMKDVLERNIKSAVSARMRTLNLETRRLKDLGSSMYQTLEVEIAKANKAKKLPQLSFAVIDMVKTGVLVTSGREEYMFLFPHEYNPKYLVDNGIRYKIAPADVERIHTDIFIQYRITLARKVVSVSTLRKDNGEEFEHYHGSSHGDCWGTAQILEEWDGTLMSLYRNSLTLVGSLGAVNMNSLLRRNPVDMPTSVVLKGRSTVMGREGDTTPAPTVIPDGAGRRAWGGRTV